MAEQQLSKLCLGASTLLVQVCPSYSTRWYLMNLHGPPAQRACLSHVSLVQAPETQAPRPVARPDDLHPLPDSIDAYFVYPFSVEELVTSPHALLTSDSVIALHERHANFLRIRKERKEREEQERFRRLAPGWAHGDGSILEPVKVSAGAAGSNTSQASPTSPPSATLKPDADERTSSSGHTNVDAVTDQLDRTLVQDHEQS